MMNNKKGISAIVATVLIILITVAAVTIIWAAIIPMISNQLESGTICLDAVSAVTLKDEGYTCFETTDAGTACLDSNAEVDATCTPGTLATCTGLDGADGNDCVWFTETYEVSLQVGRTAKDFDLNALQVLVSVGGDTTSRTVTIGTDELGPNGAEVFTVVGDDFNVATKIQIAPVVGIGNTETTCDISATKTLTEC